MKGVIALFLFFMVFTIIFSASANPAHQFQMSGRSTSTAHLNSDVFFSNVLLTNDQNGNAINNNGVICPQAITIQPDILATWPLSTSNFNALAIYPPCSGGRCPTNPSSYSHFNPLQLITWVSSSDYQEIIDAYPPTLAVTDPILNRFSDQVVSYDQREGGSIDFQNRLGGVGIYCKGETLTRIRSPDGSTVNLGSATQLPTEPSFSRSLNSFGNYVVTTELRNVRCIGAIEKRPPNDGFYFLNIYTSNPLSLATLTESKTITVEDRRAELSASGYDPAASSQFEMEEGSSETVFMTVRNTGTADMIATSVLVSDAGAGFTAEPYPVTCRSIPGLGRVCTPVSGNGFNQVIAPGETRDLMVKLHSPSSMDPNAAYSVTLTLQYGANEAVCSTIDHVISVRYVIREKPVECSPGDTRPECQSVSSCRVTPSSASVAQNDQVLLSLTCTNSTHSSFNCDSATWGVTPSGGFTSTFVQQSNLRAIVRVTSSTGTGIIRATPATGISCTSTINAGPPPSVTSCTLTPSSATVPQGDTVAISLRCSNSTHSSFNCNSATWAKNEFNGFTSVFGSQSNTAATVKVTSSTGFGRIIARPTPSVSCNSILTATTGGQQGFSCEISPSGSSVEVNTTNPFTIDCILDGVKYKCTSVDWDVDSSTVIASQNNQGININFTQPGNRDILAAATYSYTSVSGGSFSETANCNASVNVLPAGVSPSGDINCAISPASLSIRQNETQSFDLFCSNSTDTFPCESASWSVSGMSSSIISNDNVNAVINFTADPGSSGNVQVTASYDNQNPVCSSPATILGGNVIEPPECDPAVEDCSSVCPPNDQVCIDSGGRARANGCILSPQYLAVHPKETVKLTVTCTGTPDGKCTSVPSFVALSDNVVNTQPDGNSVFVELGDKMNDATEIVAYVDPAATKFCSAIITTNPFICADYT